MLYFSYILKGNIKELPIETYQKKISRSSIMFFVGLGLLLMVPIFKITTHLPPFMGMLLGLGLIWIFNAIILHKSDIKEKDDLKVSHVIKMIDTPSILFFLGILLAVSCLGELGILQNLANWMDINIGNKNIILILVGFASSILDNVPLVAAFQKMYTLDQVPTGDKMWNFLAFTAGSGGSLLVIGSAAGVAIMGSMKLEFIWYLKKISLPALVGYIIGVAVYLILSS